MFPSAWALISGLVRVFGWIVHLCCLPCLLFVEHIHPANYSWGKGCGMPLGCRLMLHGDSGLDKA